MQSFFNDNLASIKYGCIDCTINFLSSLHVLCNVCRIYLLVGKNINISSLVFSLLSLIPNIGLVIIERNITCQGLVRVFKC